jgi:hypothetical protein
MQKYFDSACPVRADVNRTSLLVILIIISFLSLSLSLLYISPLHHPSSLHSYLYYLIFAAALLH